MAKIALRAYNQEIESLIDARQIDEAIAHCRHILKTFPKHIQTYRLLGKAFLESQRYADAGDILGRVLSSIPDDFIAHVGMSVIREDEGNLAEAIYHMERAFEVQPANKAIQEELRRLYGRRDGFAPPRVRLSRGALARMYARGELYPQAIAELRAALAENPNRLDLRLLLAHNFMRMGQRVEAVDACNLLLRKIPYCLEANQIMANVLQNSERAADAAAYRRRVAALDPYEAHVSPLIPDASRVPDGTVTVERLSWQPGMPLVAGDYQPEWAASLGVHVPEEYPGLDEFPDWLGAAEKPAAKGPALVEDDGITPIKDETVEAAEAEELPEWMQQAGWKPGTGEAKEGPVFFDDESEDLLAGAEELSGLPEAELPDWVREMAPPVEQVAATQMDEWISEDSLNESSLSESSLSESSLSESSVGESPVEADAGAEELGELLAGVQEPDETPVWLSELGDAQISAEKAGPEADLAETALLGSTRAAAQESLATPDDKLAESHEAVPEAEIPDWLKDLEGGEPVAQAAAPGLGDAEGDTDSEAIPDWLAEAGAAGGDASDEVSTWLTEAAPEIVDDTRIPESIEAAEGGLPDWLSAEAEFSSPADRLRVEETSAAEELPDWLKAAQAEAPAETKPEAETPVEAFDVDAVELGPAEEADVPDWLKAAQVELSSEAEPEPDVVEIEPAEEVEIPDWLKATQGEASAEAEPEADVVEIEPAEEAEIPDWLKAAQVEAVAEDTATGEGMPEALEADEIEIEPTREEELPDWLKGAPAAGVAAGAMDSWHAEAEEPEAEAIEIEPALEAEVPDWLKEAQAAGAAELAEAAPEALEPAAAFEETDEEIAAPAAEELPEWLVEAEADETAVELAAEAGLDAGWEVEAIEIEPTAEAELPDWLKEGRASKTGDLWQVEAEAEPEAETAVEAAATDEWLAALETPVEEGDTKPGRTKLATRLERLDLTGEAGQPPVEGTAEPGEAGVFLVDEMPDWLKEMAPAGTELEAEVEAAEDDFASLFGEAEALTESTAAEELATEELVFDEPLAEELAVEELAVDDLAAEELAMELPSAGLAEAETEEIEGELIAAGLAGAGLAAAAAETTAQSEEDEFMSLFAAEEETTARTLDLEQVEAEEVEAELLVEEVAPELVEPDEAAAGVLAGEVAAASELEAEEDAAAPVTVEEEVAEASVFAELDAMASTEYGRGFAAGAEAEMEAADAEAAPPTAELLAVEGEVELSTLELRAAEEELGLPGAEPAAEETILEPQEAQSPQITAAAAEMPDFGDDMEAAFAWLEGLAARQGAKEALFTAPEDRPAAPPEWVASAVEEIPAAETAPEAAVEAEYEEDLGVELEDEPAVETEVELPAFVEDEARAAAPEVEGEAAAPVMEETPAEAVEAAETAAAADVLDVKAAWQGVEGFVPFDEDAEEEPEVKPELPAWLQEAEQAEAQAAPEVDAWVPPVAALPVEPVRAPVDLNKAGLVDLERLPGVGFTLAQKILDQRDQIGAFNSVMDLGQIPGITPDILQELEGLVKVEPPKPSITAPHLRVEGPDDLLAARQAFLNGDAEGALEQYGKLIRQRRFLPDIVNDLEKAAEANPRLAEIWQVLGDAYLRDDQLQPALEAYTKVEELLR